MPGARRGMTERMSLPPRLRRSFFDRPVLEVAPELIGATLEFRVSAA